MENDKEKLAMIEEVLSIIRLPVDQETILFKALSDLWKKGYETGYHVGQEDFAPAWTPSYAGN